MKNYNYIELAAEGKSFDARQMENFTAWNEAQPFLIEVGKRARAIVNADGMFILKMMMKEIEMCYSKALHADCGYTMHVNCTAALIWYSKMVTKKL